jgi:hypothetical protein
MVGRSVALPKGSGVPRDHEVTVAPAESAAGLGEGVRPIQDRSPRTAVLVPMLVVVQAAWLVLLAFGLLRLL